MRRKKSGERERKRRRGRSDKEGREPFSRKLEIVEQREGELDKIWEKIEGKVGKVLEGVKALRREDSKKGW